MVIALIGESCTGKSTIAAELSGRTNAAVYTGKDYVKLAKNEAEAKRLFTELLSRCETGGETVIYVVSEKEHLALLPERAVRVLVTAELDTIKERFASRMGGKLPAPVETMLERKHGMFDGERHDLRVHSVTGGVSDTCDRIMALTGSA